MTTLKQKNHYMRHQVAILTSMIEKYKPSEAIVKCDTDSEFFNDSCNFVGLYHELFELSITLKNMIKYNEVIMKELGEE